MSAPTSQKSRHFNPDELLYLIESGAQTGPLSASDIRKRWKAGSIDSEASVKLDGLSAPIKLRSMMIAAEQNCTFDISPIDSFSLPKTEEFSTVVNAEQQKKPFEPVIALLIALLFEASVFMALFFPAKNLDFVSFMFLSMSLGFCVSFVCFLVSLFPCLCDLFGKTLRGKNNF